MNVSKKDSIYNYILASPDKLVFSFERATNVDEAVSIHVVSIDFQKRVKNSN